ncbi:MAG: HprK-related kinase B, partial [bacterium]
MIKNTIKETIAGFLLDHRPVYSLALQFGLCRIRVDTDCEPLRKKMTRYFASFVTEASPWDIRVHAIETAPVPVSAPLTVKQPDPGKTKIKEEFHQFKDGLLVRKRLTGMVFLFGDGNNLAIGPCLSNDNQVVNFIINRFIQWVLNDGALLLHAAAVSYQGKGLAVSGFSGMGKSTLALHIMNRGTTFASNDRLMVKQTNGRLSMIGVPKLPRINPGTILGNQRLLGIIPREKQGDYLALPKDDLWLLEEKYDAYIDTLYGENAFKLEAELVGIVVLNWKRNSDPLNTGIVRLEFRTDLIPAFAK